jgi:ABC-type multidrug transport system fused ATPase/permease subunit
MDVYGIIVTCLHCAFIFVYLCLIWRRRKRPKWKAATSYDNTIMAAFMIDIIAILAELLKICILKDEAAEIVSEKLATVIVVLISKSLIMVFDMGPQWPLVNLMSDFALNLYGMAFVWPSLVFTSFWISAVRSLANGSLFILFLSKVIRKHRKKSSKIKDQKFRSEEKKFHYCHSSANLVSKLTFSWIFPLLIHGYKCPIEVADLEKITEEEKSQDQCDKFKKYLRHDPTTTTMGMIWKPCLKMNISLLCFGACFRIAADICSLTSALSIKWMVNSFQNSTAVNTTNANTIQDYFSSPYIIAVIILLTSILQGLFSQGSSHFCVLAGIRAKNALTVLLYEKALKLPVVKINTIEDPEAPDNESNIDVGHITNLAGEDVLNIKEVLWNIHYIWALPLKMLVIGILVQQKVGNAGAIGVALGVVLIIPMQFIVGKLMSDNNKQIQKHHDKRIFLSTEAIQGIKTLKLGCLERWKLSQIESARVEELKCLKIDSWLWSGMAFLASVSTLLVSALILGLYSVIEGQPFASSDIFTTMALLNQLTVCLSVFPVTLPIYIKGFLSSKRLKDFFHQHEIVKSNSSNNIDDGQLSAFSMTASSFNWPKTKLEAIKDITVQVRTGSLTMLVGSSGPFILAILKELELTSGQHVLSSSAAVAFVGQRPWIINATIKENILLGRPLKEKRYRKVLAACDLDADINILPLKDDTEVGEDGGLLSGGQRQRVAIARCLYSKASCTILDMPFSALDANLSLHIFQEGILKILLKRKRTVLLSTHRKDFLPKADWILAFDEKSSQLSSQGTFSVLKVQSPALFQDPCSSGRSSQLVETKTAQERWKLLKNVTKLSMTKSSMRPRPSRPSIRRNAASGFKRLESSAQLGFCHNILMHSSCIEEESESTCRLIQRSKINKAPQPNLARLAMHNEAIEKNTTVKGGNSISSPPSAQVLRTQDSMLRFQFAHRFVARMTSNASQMSGVSGFSDDQDLDDQELDHDGLIVHNHESWEEEEREKGNIKMQVTMTYFKAGGLINLGLFLALSLAFQAVKVWSDFLLNDHMHGFLNGYMTLTAVALGLSILANIFGQNLGANARSGLHQRLMSHLFQVHLHLFEILPVGRFVSRFAQDMFIIDQKLPSCLQRLAMVAFICFGGFIVNAVQSPWFLALALPLALVYWIIQHFYRKTSRELQRIEGSTRSPFISHLSDSLCSLVTLRAFGEEKRLTNQFCDRLDANTTALLLVQSGSRWLGVSLDLVGSLMVFASVMSALITVKDLEGAQETFGLALNYSLLVPIYLAWVIKFLTDLESCMNAVERVIEYTELEHEGLDDEGQQKERPKSTKISFKNVSLSHGGDIRPVVHNVNLEIPKGQKVALVGRSGSGKSTILGSLSKMTSTVQGVISMGEMDLDTMSIPVLRKMVMTVPQDVSLFAGTFRDGLDPEGQFKDKDLWQVLESLGLSEGIQAQQGLDTTIEAYGDNLSKGQKQQLSIARAVIQRPSVLILDEATSGMDLEEEQLLLEGIFKYCHQDMTLISVVHRLANITDYDRVLVIGDGRVLEDGRPRELLKKPMGFFSALWRSTGN